MFLLLKRNKKNQQLKKPTIKKIQLTKKDFENGDLKVIVEIGERFERIKWLGTDQVVLSWMNNGNQEGIYSSNYGIYTHCEKGIYSRFEGCMQK